MGKPTLGCSPIQLKLENHHRMVPIGILKDMLVDLDSVCTMASFEFIDIVDNTSPYPTLSGFDWAFDNHDIINLKTRNMIFESREYNVVVPLDPLEGGRYVEPVTYTFIIEEINKLYRTIVCEEDYINPTADGMLSWRSISSYALNFDTRLEN